MKKYLIISLILLVLVGCTKQDPLTSVPAEKKEVISSKFDYETGKCLIDTNVEYLLLNRDEEINIIGEDDNLYFIDYNGLVLGVEKPYIRTSYDEKFEEYDGYTKNGTSLYGDVDLTEKIKSFSLNDTVKVIDKFKDILIIENEGKVAYMNSNSVSKDKIVIYHAPVQTNQPVYSDTSDSGHSDSGSSGGGSSDSGSSSGDTGGGETSGDVIIDADDLSFGTENSFIKANPTYTGKVIIDNTVTYIARLCRNDIVYIVSEVNDDYQILIEGRMAKLNKKYVRKDSEEAYKTWDAYSYGGAKVYEDYEMNNLIDTLSTNDIVKVIDEIDDVCIVEFSNGQIGYMLRSKLSENKIVVYVAPKPTVQEIIPSDSGSSKDDDSSGGGSSSGGDSGGGGGDTPSTPEETEPKL